VGEGNGSTKTRERKVLELRCIVPQPKVSGRNFPMMRGAQGMGVQVLGVWGRKGERDTIRPQSSHYGNIWYTRKGGVESSIEGGWPIQAW